MRHQLLIRIFIFLLTMGLNFETLAGVKEALKFAREGINKAVELAPKVKKRKSFDSRNYYPGEIKVFYKVSMKRDTTNDVIIKSTGYSEVDEVTIEIKLSRIEKVEMVEKAVISAWGMLNRKNFIKSDRKTDKVEFKIGDYDVEINVKFEGSEQAEIKIAKIKIIVVSPVEEFEKAVVQAIRRYKVSDGSFI